MSEKKFVYRKALEEIEQIVYKIENDEPDIDELSDMVKRAADLIKKCKNKLKNTSSELDDIIEKLDE